MEGRRWTPSGSSQPWTMPRGPVSRDKCVHGADVGGDDQRQGQQRAPDLAAGQVGPRCEPGQGERDGERDPGDQHGEDHRVGNHLERAGTGQAGDGAGEADLGGVVFRR